MSLAIEVPLIHVHLRTEAKSGWGLHGIKVLLRREQAISIPISIAIAVAVVGVHRVEVGIAVPIWVKT